MLWWGLYNLQMGANDVELACLSIPNESCVGGRENLKPSGCWSRADDTDELLGTFII